MLTGFYSDRKWIENEYEEGGWDESSGLAPEELDRLMRAYCREHAQEAPETQVANCYRIMLENVQLGLNPHTMFPDKMRHGGVYRTSTSGSVMERINYERYVRAFERNCPAAWHQRSVFAKLGLAIPDTDVWHTLVDWQRVLHLGAPGLLQALKDARAEKAGRGCLEAGQARFYDAEIMVFGALIVYMRRLRDAARLMGLQDYALALEELLAHAPQTLYQVLCLTHIVLSVEELGRERCRSLGPIDEMYLPFYLEDVRQGRLNRETCKEMFRYFFQKIAAEKRYADQPICIGKTWKEDGSEAADFILMMLEAYEELGIHSPKIHVRCAKDMSDVLLGKLTGMIRGGCSSMVLVNDETVFKGYEQLGIPRDVADRYVPLGCYESTLMGLEDSRICASWINLVKACEYTITGGKDLLGGIWVGQRTEEPKTWQEFLQTYYSYLHEHCLLTMNLVDVQAAYAYEANPSPVFSGTIASCVERGRDVFNGGMVYRNQSIKCFAIATAVDSLLTVKKFVYEDRKLTLAQLRDILLRNWEGAEELRSEIMHSPIKYGNFIPEADDLARDIFDFCAEEIIGKPTSTGGVFRLGCDSVNMAEDYGYYTGASADGRLAREPLSKNLRPVNGMERKGVTALIQSVCHLNNACFVDGAPLDFVVHPSAVEGEDGLNAMKAMIRTFFAKGGFAIQGNILSLDMLLDAREHPGKYPTLQVRVCGWNEYFVNMNKQVQDDFIKRTTGIEQ